MLITTADAAKRLGINRRTVILWIQSRGLPAYRLSGIWRIEDQELEDWIKKRKVNVGRGKENIECLK